MLELREIEYLISIVDNRSFSQAARQLYVSQPALSQAVQRIEKQLGVKLFIRASGSGNLLTPTDACQKIVSNGRTMLAHHKLLIDELSGMQNTTKTLRFGMSSFYSKHYLPKTFEYYKKFEKNVSLEVVEKKSSDLEDDIICGSLDFAFVPALPARPELDYITVATEEIFLGIPPRHPLNEAAVTLTDNIKALDLRQAIFEPFILQPSIQKISAIQNRIFEHAGFRPLVIHETPIWDVAYRMTYEGIGLSLLPDVLRCDPYLTNRPNFYRIVGVDCTRPYAVAFRHGYVPDHSISKLIQVLSKVIVEQMTHPLA